MIDIGTGFSFPAWKSLGGGGQNVVCSHGHPLAHPSHLHWPETSGPLWHRPQEQRTEGQLRESGPEGEKRDRRHFRGNGNVGWCERMRKTAGDSRLTPAFRPEGILTAPGGRKRIFVLSEEKVGRKIKTVLICQASPNYIAFYLCFSQLSQQEATWRVTGGFDIVEAFPGGVTRNEVGVLVVGVREFGAAVFAMT